MYRKMRLESNKVRIRIRIRIRSMVIKLFSKGKNIIFDISFFFERGGFGLFTLLCTIHY